MILDIIANRGRCRGIGSGIERALDYLANTDFDVLEDGRHEIEGDGIYALLMSYETEPQSVRSFEAHRKYVDIQFILSGREIIYWAPLEELAPAGEYDDGKDIIFLAGDPRARLQLTPGSFVVFHPEDGHKPNCAWDGPEPVRKVVVKVRVV